MTEMYKPDFKEIPGSPGVYVMYGDKGQVLYVGKAGNLKKRVSSYWQKTNQQSPKTEKLLERVQKLDFIVTASEYEALALESNLIKQYRPPFNVILRDDKSYLYLRFDLSADFPIPEFVRRIEKDKAVYFGPFTDSYSVKQTLRFLRKIFPYCDKKLPNFAELKKQAKLQPCLSYRLQLCPGACLGLIKSKDYHKNIQGIIEFFRGHQTDALLEADKRMKEMASAKRFEEAGKLRDLTASFKKLRASQRVVSQQLLDFDAVAIRRLDNLVLGALVSVREGRVVGQQLINIEDSAQSADEEVMGRLLTDHYQKLPDLPKEIVVSVMPSGIGLLERYLARLSGHKIKISLPQRGARKAVINLAQANAEAHIKNVNQLLGGSSRGKILDELKDVLRLPKLPKRIEIFDISHSSGTNMVGSMVVFVDGKPSPKDYRRFQIKTVHQIDDYSALQEVIKRRFARNGDERFATAPDLLLIDGGKGQLNAVLKILAEVGEKKMSVISLAKQEEEIFVMWRTQPLRLDRSAPTLRLLQQMRDEAHRFAIGYQARLSRKGMTTSRLDRIAGIGNKRRHDLLKAFGSVEGIKQASDNEIAKVIGDAKLVARLKREL